MSQTNLDYICLISQSQLNSQSGKNQKNPKKSMESQIIDNSIGINDLTSRYQASTNSLCSFQQKKQQIQYSCANFIKRVQYQNRGQKNSQKCLSLYQKQNYLKKSQTSNTQKLIQNQLFNHNHIENYPGEDHLQMISQIPYSENQSQISLIINYQKFKNIYQSSIKSLSTTIDQTLINNGKQSNSSIGTIFSKGNKNNKLKQIDARIKRDLLDSIQQQVQEKNQNRKRKPSQNLNVKQPLIFKESRPASSKYSYQQKQKIKIYRSFKKQINQINSIQLKNQPDNQVDVKKISQLNIITNKGEHKSSNRNTTNTNTQYYNKKGAVNSFQQQQNQENQKKIQKYSDSQGQDKQRLIINNIFFKNKKIKIRNFSSKLKLQNQYTKIFYKDKTLKNIQSVNQLELPSNADKHQNQLKADRANKNIKQTSQIILKDKKYPKKDLYLPTFQQLRIFHQTYQNDIQKNLLKMKQEISSLQKELKQLKEQSKLQLSKRIKQKQSQVKTLSTFYIENLKPQINKINFQLKKYLFEDFYQNFTTVQTQLYEFFQFNNNIIVKNEQLRNTQKRIKQPKQYFRLIEKQLNSKQNKKSYYREQSNKYNLERFKNDNIQIKNWQKMKKYFQNPSQQYEKKFKFLISPILNRNVYCWNKVYNKLEKKFSIDNKIQSLESSVIQLPVNMYSLSYVVMVCLEITEKKQLLSQIQDLAQLSQRIVENIFERPKDKELKMEKQLKDQIKYNEMLSKEDVLLEENITKKGKIYELELETWMLLVNFVEELIKKIVKIQYRQDYTRRKVAQKFLIDFIETFYLYNYVVSIYQNQYGKMLDFKYFTSLINRQNAKQSSQNESVIETKLNVFWQSFFYIQLVQQKQKYQIAYLSQKGNSHYRINVLRFVYLRCISQELVPQSQQRVKKVKQVKQINEIKQLKLKEQTKKLPQPKYFNFGLFYNDIYPINSQQNMIELETKYMIHFSQYCYQIIAELSEAKNISLDVVFNCIRFLLINLILHFTNLCFDEIQRSIQKSCGRLHKKKFIDYKNKNDKWIDCTNKSIKAIDWTYKKLLTYIQQITNPQKLRQSANVQKIKKMLQEQQEMMSVFLAFNIDTTKVRSIERTEHLLGDQKIASLKHIFNQNVDRDQQLFKYLKKNYNEYNLAKRYQNVKTTKQFQEVQNRPKYLYRFIIEQLRKEYISTQIIEKTFKKVLKKHLGEQAAMTYDFKKYSKNLKFIFLQEQKNNRNDSSMFKKTFDRFQKQWWISVNQTAKLISLVENLPFFSIAISRNNQHNINIRIFNKQLNRKQPQKLFQIIKKLNSFFIYKAERLNTQYLQQKYKIDDILQIKLKYLKYTKRILYYFSQLRQKSFWTNSTQLSQVKNLRYIQELQLTLSIQIQSIQYNYLSPQIVSMQNCTELLDLLVQSIQKKFNELQKKDNQILYQIKQQAFDSQDISQFCGRVFRIQVSQQIFKSLFIKGEIFLFINNLLNELQNVYIEIRNQQSQIELFQIHQTIQLDNITSIAGNISFDQGQQDHQKFSQQTDKEKQQLKDIEQVINYAHQKLISHFKDAYQQDKMRSEVVYLFTWNNLNKYLQ